jgi:hypothetical protein
VCPYKGQNTYNCLVIELILQLSHSVTRKVMCDTVQLLASDSVIKENLSLDIYQMPMHGYYNKK